MWQIKDAISPLSQGLWTPNLAGWWFRMKEPHPQSHVTHRPHGHAANQRSYISTFTRPKDPKLSRILVILWLLRWGLRRRKSANPSTTLFLDPSLSKKVYIKLNGIKMLVFFEKSIKKKHFCSQDKNYCYFCKSNIPVINLIVGFRNMIKLSTNVSL